MFAPDHETAKQGTDLSYAAGLFIRRDWWTEARCGDDGVDTELFFSEEIAEIAQAKMICAGCPALAPCLEEALERREPWGVWGGQLFQNGRIRARKRPRGRPPKIPRPEDEMPDIPVPEHLRNIA